MPRWKGLPATLDPGALQLVVQLRRLKDQSGLSLASLAGRTAYSRSSWGRFLNGRQMPPRGAVEALARVCGADPARLLALQEVAAEAWGTGGEAAGEAGPSAGAHEGEGGAAHPRRRTVVLLAAAGAALAALAAGLLITSPWQEAAGNASRPVQEQGTFTPRPGQVFDCRIQRADGELYAGHSRTRRAILWDGAAGWDVVEAQCLLKEHGADPGAVDGIVGDNTMRAVKRFQVKVRLPVDGIVGPDTWKGLRT